VPGLDIRESCTRFEEENVFVLYDEHDAISDDTLAFLPCPFAEVSSATIGATAAS
jgi:hypothetical protein